MENVWTTFESNIPDPWLPIAKRIDILENAIYEQGIFLFGTKSPQVKKSYATRRQKQIFALRGQLNDLKQAWKNSTADDERAGIELLQSEAAQSFAVLDLPRVVLIQLKRFERKNNKLLKLDTSV